MTPSDHPDARRQLEGEAMTMRERIARALFVQSEREDGCNPGPAMLAAWFEDDDPDNVITADQYRRQADAVLATLAQAGLVIAHQDILISARDQLLLHSAALQALQDWIASDDGPTPPLALVEKLEAFAEASQ